MLSSTPNILQPDKDLHLNVDRIKETPFEELPKEDRITLVLVLLKQLQPYFSTHNLNIAPPSVQTPLTPKKAALRGSGSQPPMSGRNRGAATHRTQPLQGEDEGINRLLNNINVQKQSNLPPISQK